LSFIKIVFYFLVKVDGHVSRASRDKCPVHFIDFSLLSS
jgi:hypothetical protein